MMDGIMKMLRKWPFRCRGCSRRFYRSSKFQPGVDQEKEA
jgi:hypothetical protein